MEIIKLKNGLGKDIPLTLGEILDKGEEILGKAEKSNIDLSQDFHFETRIDFYRLQEDVRLYTRTLSFRFKAYSLIEGYKDEEEISTDVGRVLNHLNRALKLFKGHAFHHVIFGRLIDAVNEAYEQEADIPENYESYIGMVKRPWENPHLNYCCVRELEQNLDILPLGVIPPEYRG